MKIPISRIRPNPNNPRHVIKPSALDGLAANIKSVGRLLNPIKVRELTVEEKAEDPEHDYEIISGHLRFYACQKLGWTEIDAIIRKYGSLAEKFDEEVGDNIDKDMMWLEWYMIIEKMMIINPKLTQKEVADRVVKTQQYVSRAIKALPLLNKSAREAIYTLSVKSEDWEVSELAVLALTGLARGKPDDTDLIERALKVVLERRMTEQQAKKLVSWIKKGNTPESFPVDGSMKAKKGMKQQNFDPNDPDAGYLKNLPKSIKVSNISGGNKTINAKLERSKSLLFLYGGMAALKKLELRQRPEQAGKGNEFEDELPSIYDIAIGKVNEDIKRQQEDIALREEVEGENGTGVSGKGDGAGEFPIPNGSAGMPNSGKSGVSDSTGVPSLQKQDHPDNTGVLSMKGLGGKSFSDNTGVLSLLKNAAAASTPKHISGKILKWIVMWMADKFNSSKVKGQEEQRNGKEGVSGKGEVVSESQIPNSENPKLSNSIRTSHVVRGTVVIVLIVAAGIFAMRIIPAIMHRMAASFTTQKPALMPVVTQISTASYAQAPVSRETSSFVKTTADKSAGKPVYKPTVKPKDKTVNKKPQIKKVYAAASPSVPYDMSDEWKQAMQDYKQKNYEGALLWLGKTEDIYGDKPYICKYMADCEYIQSDFNEAEEHYKEYLEMNPGDKDAEEKIKKCESELALPPAPDGTEGGK